MFFRCDFLITICVLIFSVNVVSDSKVKSPVMPLPVDIALKTLKAIISINSATEEHVFRDDVKNSLKRISQQLEGIKALITQQSSYIIDKLSTKIDMETVIDFVRVVERINKHYEKEFLKYFMENNTYEMKTIEKYIEASIDSSSVFRQQLLLVEEYTSTVKHSRNVKFDSVFTILHRASQEEIKYHEDCDTGNSAHQQINAAYNIAVMAISKGYTMIIHAYKYRQQLESNRNLYKSELHDASNNCNESIFKITRAARAYLTAESRKITTCSHSPHSEGVNYRKYQFLGTYLRPNDVFTVPKNRKCYGRIRQCQYNYYIEGACLASPETGRVYEYVWEHGGDFDYHRYYKGSPSGTCPSEYSLHYLRDFLEWRICVCEEPYSPIKGALFNMSEQISDISNNRVITGIRFRSKWSVTYIEIQEGELINGSIDPNTVKWNDEVTQLLEEYERKNAILPTYLKDKLIDLKTERIAFNLDDVVLPVGMVVAGIKFNQDNNGHISLMVGGWRLYDKFGYPLPSEDIEWFSVKGLVSDRRSMVYMDNIRLPYDATGANYELSSPGTQFIKFQMSDWGADASQTVIPFLDLTEVVSEPPAPLSGIGVFYKAQQRYAGYIALKTITTDYSFFMSDECLGSMYNNTNNGLMYMLWWFSSNDTTKPYPCIYKE